VRHRRQGVKREHAVLGEYRAIYERIADLPGVEGVIPGRIASNPTHHPGLVLKTATQTGFKLLAKTNTSIQEVFVVVRHGALDLARAGLAPLLERPEPPRPQRRRPAPPRRPAGRRNPGVLPTGPEGRPPLRYTAGPPPRGPGLQEGLDPASRRRLLWLRLRRVRWRRRFGVPLRRAPRRP
jgi:hypothetical protein